MPYKSDSQRKFFHTDTAKAAGITGDEVKEFDKASKGKELPEHAKKMADGGTVGESDEADLPIEPIKSPEDAVSTLADQAPSPIQKFLSAVGNMPVKPVIAPKYTGIEFSKRFADGGLSDDVTDAGTAKIDTNDNPPDKFMGELQVGIKNGINHDSDAVKSYLASKFAQLLQPTMEDTVSHDIPTELSGSNAPDEHFALTGTENTSEPNEAYTLTGKKGMSDGGYPHVTFMEDETPEAVKKTTHLADAPKMAEGGTIHKAEDRNKEPAKPKDIEMSHEKKLDSIYRAMGVKGYDDGGVVTPPTDSLPTPTPSDPTYWDQIKSALSKFSDSPAANIAGMAANPVSGVANVVENAAPGIMKAEGPAASQVMGAMAGGATPTLPVATPPVPPAVAPIAPPVMPPAMATKPSAPGSTVDNDALNNLFNQDTSKLEQGVTPEDRQALVNQLQTQQHGIGNVIAEAVSGLGDAFAAKGGKEQHSLQGIFSMQKDQRAEALANFDKARQDRLQKLDIQTKTGDNAIKKLAAQDAYGTDEHLNAMLGAPKGTAHKDLGLYFQAKAQQAVQQERDADLYLKGHAQAGTDVDNAVKGASMLNIKPSAAQIEAAGNKRAEQLINGAKGNVLVKRSNGQMGWIPAASVARAQQLDPSLQVQPTPKIGL